MSMTIHVDIVSAEAEIFSGTATMVFAPGEMGELGIAPRHTPLISRLKAGEVRLQHDNAPEDAFFVSGGILEIQPHVVTVLADTAVRAADIDEAAAIEAKKRAEDAIANQQGDFELAAAHAELAEASARIEAIRKMKNRS